MDFLPKSLYFLYFSLTLPAVLLMMSMSSRIDTEYNQCKQSLAQNVIGRADVGSACQSMTATAWQRTVTSLTK